MTIAAAVEHAIICCICFNVYRNPHSLPCLHTICKQCIEQLAVTGKVECPECRETSHVRKIRKDFKTQTLIDAHNVKCGEKGDGSDDGDVCGICKGPGKVFHCEECVEFMCIACEHTHKAIKACRGHTVRVVKEMEEVSRSKLANIVYLWNEEKTKITKKTNKIEVIIKSVQGEKKQQIELTNNHFDKLIHNLEKARLALVNEIRGENDLSLQSLWKNKGLYDQLSREIEVKIDVLHEVMDGNPAGTMNDMVDDLDNGWNEKYIQIRRRIESLDVEGGVPIKLCIDSNVPFINPINTGIKLEKGLTSAMGTDKRSPMLQINYLKLKSNKYQFSGRQKALQNAFSIHRIRIIRNYLWCAAWGNGIQIYDMKQQFIENIKTEGYIAVNGLAECHDNIIVACYIRGLHQITFLGEYLQKIVGGEYSDVCSNGEYVYGLMYCLRIIVVFSYENNKWTKKYVIPLKIGNIQSHFDKLIVHTNSLFVSLYKENCIQKYSLHGELQETFSGFNGPILCGVDVHENLLVADGKNKQLKVYYSKEQAFSVVLKLDAEASAAVMDGDNIWIVTSGDPPKIIKFEKDWWVCTLLHRIVNFIFIPYLLWGAVTWVIENF